MPVFSLNERRVEFRGANHYIAWDATLAGSIILENAVNIWFNVVLRAAKIGAGSLLGAGSLVPEGKEIPPGVLAVGSPAKVVRELNPAQIAGILAASQGYVERARLFREHLKEQKA